MTRLLSRLALTLLLLWAGLALHTEMTANEAASPFALLFARRGRRDTGAALDCGGFRAEARVSKSY